MQKDDARCENLSNHQCYGACEQDEHPAEYNKRVQEACDSLKTLPSFAIVDKGVQGEDLSCILISKGKFYGMGYIPAGTQVQNEETIKDYLTEYRENSFIRNIVHGFAARFPAKVIYL
jgi:DNA polymerase-3 subunit epsilon